MRLYPLDQTSGTAGNLREISKELKIKILTFYVRERITSLIVLADGRHDDIAVALIAHHQNGRYTVGIVKPKGKTRYACIEILPSYVKIGNIRKIAFFIDQEDESLESVYRTAENKLRKTVNDFEVLDERERVKIYRCNYGGKEFDFIFVVNGLNDIPARKHCIEDHFIHVAMNINPSINISSEIDPKVFWKRLNEDIKKDVLKQLKGNRRLLRDNFPQQVYGCELLEKD